MYTTFGLENENSLITEKKLLKLQLNPYHYKFISTLKQKYNSKFLELETVRTLKI